MESYAPLSPAAAEALPLAPLAPRGARAAAPDAESFKQLLASQGVKIPGGVDAGGAMSEAEARVTAAQIASKAGVNAGVKRDRVIAGMETDRPAVAAQPGRFMPLRQGPGAARIYNGPATAVETASTSLAGLRATQKFSPGPTGVHRFTPPVVANAMKRPLLNGGTVNDMNASIQPSVSAPKAAEAYAYGLEATAGDAARGQHAGEVPPWFQGAMQDALNKYDAMKANPALK
jgi:hypothetical protein